MSAPSPQPLLPFDRYSDRFIEIAAARGYSRESDYVRETLGYAKRLSDAGLPIIFSVDHFCALVGYSRSFIDAAAAAPEQFYRTFEVPKRNGGVRRISEPLPSLKEIQRWIYVDVLRRVAVSPAAKAYVPKSSLKDSARLHVDQEFVLRMDLKDFFPSIARRRVFGLFRSWGYASSVASVLSRLCCVEDSLPQGGVCSPYLSNLISRGLDARLLAFCRKRKLRYSRYADDFSISGKYFTPSIINFVEKTALAEGFVVNEEKTAVMRRGGRQIVVGAVVNRRPNAPREFRRKLRQWAYFVEKYGLDNHLAQLGEFRSSAREHYLGKAAFALMLNGFDRDAIALRDAINSQR